MIDAKSLIGTHDFLFVTLDALRYDVARDALENGMTPGLASFLPGGTWENRYTPACFTLPAHQAFFAGFLPVPTEPGVHPRLFAAEFSGSETIGEKTFVFSEANLVKALENRGYRTVCIGGVGFFNKKTMLSRQLPDLFMESHWSEDMGVTSPKSAEVQVRQAVSAISALDDDRRVFLFLNISATHQPNCIFLDGANEDSPETQAAALAHADRHLPFLVETMSARAPLLFVICADHGTAYGEDGFTGHRTPQPVVNLVPYAETVLGSGGEQA